MIPQAIAAALSRGENFEVIDRQGHTCKIKAYEDGLYLVEHPDYLHYCRSLDSFTIPEDPGPKPGDLLMYWDNPNVACITAGPLSMIGPNRPIGAYHEAYAHCARLDTRLLGAPPASWPEEVVKW